MDAFALFFVSFFVNALNYYGKKQKLLQKKNFIFSGLTALLYAGISGFCQVLKLQKNEARKKVAFAEKK